MYYMVGRWIHKGDTEKGLDLFVCTAYFNSKDDADKYMAEKENAEQESTYQVVSIMGV